MYFLGSLIMCICLLNMGLTAPISQTEAMDFLTKFGYMENKTEVEAIKTFQGNFEIPETGMLDAATLSMMEQPRCGHPDSLKSSAINEINAWSKNYLTYNIKNKPVSGRLTLDEVHQELKEAFKIWEKEIPVTIEHNREYGDIEVRFTDPRNGEKSDGLGKTLAYAYYPAYGGDIYFDVENWSLDTGTGTNFRTVAAHEIGHSLGLTHSMDRQALMYPYIRSFQPGWTLPRRDKLDIKALYNKDHLCLYGQIDGILRQSDQSLMVIKGRHCWKFSKNKLVADYPRLCETIWPQFPSRIDGIFTHNNEVYFFSENALYSLGNTGRERVNINLESIRKIDTILIIENRLYIFQGTKYWSFIRKNNSWSRKAESKIIDDFWKGVPSNLDAAIYNTKNHVFFFKGADVYTFNIETKTMVKGPYSIKEFLSC